MKANKIEKKVSAVVAGDVLCGSGFTVISNRGIRTNGGIELEGFRPGGKIIHVMWGKDTTVRVWS